ncbi:MAG: PQQ-dependent sugar dehydrogenase [Candidatus Obscuribacterales bacterium]|nr:PQQ-dependent sugar dehydrogenase [Candidatus Obscuribacterales bacterium]
MAEQKTATKNFRLSVFSALLLGLACVAFFLIEKAQAVHPINLDKIKLPPGFKIETYCATVPGARQMCLSDNGILYVGTKGIDGSKGPVYAVIDKDHDGHADAVKIVAKDLFMPNGVAWRKGCLYVAEVNKISRYDDIDNKLDNPPAPRVVYGDLPSETHHGWKYIRFGPDDLLYVPVGAPCNVCLRPDDARFASLCRIRPDGSNLEIFAKGIRNTVGFDWQPKTKELWFTDNGRDLLGDNIPPDELNHAPVAGMNFGFPYRWGANQMDKDFGDKDRDKSYQFTPPAQELGPHVAALGVRFYNGKMFPAEYTNQAFICEHGSWNRTNPFGYRITLVTMNNSKATGYKIFAEGWLQDDGKPFGRPNDLCIMPDGALLISDDFGGAIYRISYDEKSAAKGGTKLSGTIVALKSAYPSK